MFTCNPHYLGFCLISRLYIVRQIELFIPIFIGRDRSIGLTGLLNDIKKQGFLISSTTQSTYVN